MIGSLITGLFITSISFLKEDVNTIKTTAVEVSTNCSTSVQRDVVASKKYVDNVSVFIISLLFSIFLAMYRSTSFKSNVALSLFKVATICFISPFLIGLGLYVDGIVTLVVLLGRYLYLSYFWFKFERFEFLFYNVSTLMFVHGKAAPYLRSSNHAHYVTLYGSLNHMRVEDFTLYFVDPMLVKIAIRGFVQLDLNVVRSIELLNGDFIYIFSPEPVVGVYNAAFSHDIVNEIKLDDHSYEVPDRIDCD